MDEGIHDFCGDELMHSVTGLFFFVSEASGVLFKLSWPVYAAFSLVPHYFRI